MAVLITQVHIEQGCASETQQQLLQTSKHLPKFPQRDDLAHCILHKPK